MDKLFIGTIQEVPIELAVSRSSNIILSQEDFDETHAILSGLGVLMDRESLILAYYFCGYSLSEIRDLLCCSYSYVNKVLKRSFLKLVNYYRSHSSYIDWVDVYEDLTNRDTGGF
jgi:DNA-directed RNA polymerase specialized sigma24 family protein